MPKNAELRLLGPSSQRGLREPHTSAVALNEASPSETQAAGLRPELENFLWLQREVRKRLPPNVFVPRTQRLLWLPFHGIVVGLGIFWLATARPGFGLSALLSLAVGLSFAGLAFVGHEALHGGLVQGARARYWVGFLGFLPFSVSPRLWVAWHNRVHHAHTNELGADPDCLASLEEFEADSSVRFSTRIQVLSLGLLTLFVGFTAQSLTVLFRAKRRGYLRAEHYRRAVLETVLAFALWASLFLLGGFSLLFWAYLVPLCIGNAIVMAHIVTNHGLSPLATSKDPLETSLTVTVPRWFSFYTLDFGYHVEHHLLPGVSHHHGPLLQKLLLELAPERYQSLPLTVALQRYFKLLRIYQNANTLTDPDTGQSEPTLAARSAGSTSRRAPPTPLVGSPLRSPSALHSEPPPSFH